MTDNTEALPPMPEPDCRLPMDGPPRFRADQMRAYARAALAQRQQVPEGWQPIKTAPRDGTNLLLRFGLDCVSQGKFVPGLPHPWKFLDTNDGIAWLVNHAVDGPGGPSHWMRLPSAAITAAPSAQAERRVECDACPTALGCLGKCMKAAPPAAHRQQVLHKNWTQWAESKGLLPETVAYEAMRLAFEAGSLAKRQQVPLTDEQIDALWRSPMSADWEHREFARAIERAHGIGKQEGK